MTAPAASRVRVYWMPGCTSCLRTKEFLTQQGVDYESINAQNNPEAQAELKRLGARGMPVVAMGDRFTLCQSFGDVLKFLGLTARLADPLPPEDMFRKIDLVLTAAARYTRQFPPDKLGVQFRDRERSVGDTSFHTFRVVEMGLQAAERQGMDYEGFADLAPPDWTFEQIAAWGEQVRDRMLAWWDCQTDRELKYAVETYYGNRALHDVLDRVTYHCAQHTRQLMLMLESFGIAPDQPLTADDLKGVPVPQASWG